MNSAIRLRLVSTLRVVILALAPWAPHALSQVITEYSLPSSAACAEEIALGPDGNLWFTAACSDSIGRITPAGAVTGFRLPGPCDYMGCYPWHITAGPDGAMWYTELYSGGGVGRVTMDGILTEPFDLSGQGAFGAITSHGGYLWWVSLSSTIVRMTTTGSTRRFPLTGYNVIPYSICSGDDGVWFTEDE